MDIPRNQQRPQDDTLRSKRTEVKEVVDLSQSESGVNRDKLASVDTSLPGAEYGMKYGVPYVQVDPVSGKFHHDTYVPGRTKIDYYGEAVYQLGRCYEYNVRMFAKYNSSRKEVRNKLCINFGVEPGERIPTHCPLLLVSISMFYVFCLP